MNTLTGLCVEAAAPYRAGGRYARHFARGKLGGDPAFAALLRLGLLPDDARVLDLGCGQALLASWLHTAAARHARGLWPADWPPPPRPGPYHGIELMMQDVHRAEAALAPLGKAVQVIRGDVRTTAFPASDVVVILDVLHYVDHAAQADLLARVRSALGRRGRLLLRVGDMDDARGFAASQWVDRLVTTVRGHRVPPTWGRSVAQWRELLQGLGFAVQALPMSRGTPFANVLLLADAAAIDGDAA